MIEIGTYEAIHWRCLARRWKHVPFFRCYRRAVLLTRDRNDRVVSITCANGHKTKFWGPRV